MPLSYDNVVGSVTIQGVTEPFTTSTGTTGTYNYDFQAAGNVVWFEAPTGNITFNITNYPTDNSRVITFTAILNQGATARTISALQIGGSAQTINWANGVTPTGTANKKDVYTFTIARSSGGAYTTLGSMTSYG